MEDLTELQEIAKYIRRIQEQSDYALLQALKPRIFRDGDQWCCMYGDNLQDSIVGFGNRPQDAYADFCKAWWTPIPKPHRANNSPQNQSHES